MSRRCEQDGCRKQPSFGYPGGRPVRCATHRLAGMVSLCCSWQCAQQKPHWGLHVHRVRRSKRLCGAAGGCREPHVPSRWLLQTSVVWLPRGRKSALRHAQTRRHCRPCCSLQCAQQMCPSEAALAQGAMQRAPVWACRRT